MPSKKDRPHCLLTHLPWLSDVPSSAVPLPHTHVQVHTHPRGAGQTCICHPAVSAGSQLWHSRGSRHSLRPRKSLTVKPASGSKAGFSLVSRQKSCRKEGTWFLHFRLQRIAWHQMKVVSSCQICRLHGKKQNQHNFPLPHQARLQAHWNQVSSR